jgi:meso-butanediol dehydrogenase / (S,S)-butanediol dehydrogenase / diacetyl reductase
MCQAFARAVRQAQTRAAIVNLSSAAGIRGVPNRLPYSASKYGIVGITQTMALELGPLGVRVNAVVPGDDPYANGGGHVRGPRKC